jgi:hypothetical protein
MGKTIKNPAHSFNAHAGLLHPWIYKERRRPNSPGNYSNGPYYGYNSVDDTRAELVCLANKRIAGITGD